jgi:hypothetical protein
MRSEIVDIGGNRQAAVDEYELDEKEQDDDDSEQGVA